MRLASSIKAMDVVSVRTKWFSDLDGEVWKLRRKSDGEVLAGMFVN
jgi:hypothetical protein